jgi:hypothetical protein
LMQRSLRDARSRSQPNCRYRLLHGAYGHWRESNVANHASWDRESTWLKGPPRSPELGVRRNVVPAQPQLLLGGGGGCCIRVHRRGCPCRRRVLVQSGGPRAARSGGTDWQHPGWHRHPSSRARIDNSSEDLCRQPQTMPISAVAAALDASATGTAYLELSGVTAARAVTATGPIHRLRVELVFPTLAR